MERERYYALEVCEHLRRRLIGERLRPLGLDPMYDFYADDVHVEPGTNGAGVVVLFRVCGRERLLGFRSEMVDYTAEFAHRENAEQEIVEIDFADVLAE